MNWLNALILYRELLKLFQEINYWERLQFEIPHYAIEIYGKKEELRNLRENVLLVVRDYNRSVDGSYFSLFIIFSGTFLTC